MIRKELKQHQWKAFKRHPLFEKNLLVKIFLFISLGYFAFAFFLLGFFLDRIFLATGKYSHAIDGFHAILVYILIGDFSIKYAFKKNQSMQITPYMVLPVKRSSLFNFLLSKEFYNIWNLFGLVVIVPFAFKAAPPVYGMAAPLLFILYFYLLSIINSLLVASINAWTDKKWWRILLPVAMLSGVIAGITLFDLPAGDYSLKAGDWLLRPNLLMWTVVMLLFVLLWSLNHQQMRARVYSMIEGEKIAVAKHSHNITFLNQWGEIGSFLNLEFKLIFRNPRLKKTIYSCLFFLLLIIFNSFVNSAQLEKNFFSRMLYTSFSIGCAGFFLSQFQFMAESSYFDGLMARKHSFVHLIKAKYLLAITVATFLFLCSLVLVYFEKESFLFLFSVYLYTIGLIYFLMFQNGVYNKTPFDLSDSGFGNWKSSSLSQMIVSLVGIFAPILLVSIIRSVFSAYTATLFMIITGAIFLLGANVWLNWTAKRVLKRKYILMEGFRSSN